MKLSGSEIIVQGLEREGIKVVAGIPGGANLPLYRVLGDSSIKHILARHEQGAGFIAQGMARITGKPAVCLATSGPGATNLMTALADAKLDSIPIVAITGQVPRAFIGTDAFQEVDTYGMSLPFTKHNYFIHSATDLITAIPEAFRIAASGRPGPVLIDVPKDVQKEVVDFPGWPEESQLIHEIVPEPKQENLEQAAEMIRQSERPLFYIGGGIVHAGASSQVLEIAEKNSIPVTHTLMGAGTIPADHELNIGMLGMHGAPYTNYLVHEADLLIAVGVRFDDRATGKLAEFCPDARVIHFDIDPSEVNKLRKSDLHLVSDAAAALDGISKLLKKQDRSAWINHVRRVKEENPLPGADNDDFFDPINLTQWLGWELSADTPVVTDVGQHQMWVAQFYPFRKPRTQLTSGGLGTMGFGLPTALGAAVAAPDKTIVCVSGDGSILMNIQELAVLSEENLNVKVILMNNGYLGLVRQQQQLFYDDKHVGSRFECRPDFAAIASAFGIKGIDLTGDKNAEDTLRKALNEPGPAFINVPIAEKANVLPIVTPGEGNHKMIGTKVGSLV